MSSAKRNTEMISLLLDKLISLDTKTETGAARIFRHIEKGANVVWSIQFDRDFHVHFVKARFISKSSSGVP